MRSANGNKGVEHTQGRNKTDTKTGEKATGDEQWLSRGSGLQDDTKVEDETDRDEKTNPSAHEVAKGRSSKRTEECTSRQNGDDERIFRRGKGFVGRRRELIFPVVHGQNSRNRASVISSVV